MALPKRVKVGGTYFKGQKLAVSSAVGNYALAIIPTNSSYAVTSFSVTPDSYGAGDTFTITHVDTTAAAGGVVITTLVDGVYNLGAGVTVGFDLSSLELIDQNQSLRFVYANAATQAMNVYVTVEVIK